jgi:hypothetical protein
MVFFTDLDGDKADSARVRLGPVDTFRTKSSDP